MKEQYKIKTFILVAIAIFAGLFLGNLFFNDETYDKNVVTTNENT